MLKCSIPDLVPQDSVLPLGQRGSSTVIRNRKRYCSLFLYFHLQVPDLIEWKQLQGMRREIFHGTVENICYMGMKYDNRLK